MAQFYATARMMPNCCDSRIGNRFTEESSRRQNLGKSAQVLLLRLRLGSIRLGLVQGRVNDSRERDKVVLKSGNFRS